MGTLSVIALAGGVRSLKVLGFLALYALVVTTVCLLVCVVPTRRALRIQPTDAMRAADA